MTEQSDFVRQQAEWAAEDARADHPAARPNGIDRLAATLRQIDPTQYQDSPVPERQWIVPQWIPRGVVTGLYGPGGYGKTLLAQQLMTATALGKSWLGLPAARGKSLAVFCEDDQDELHRRQADINRLYECDFRDLADMRWASRLGDEDILMHFGGGRGELTRFAEQLLAASLDFGAQLVIVDTVADAFGGNQNDAGQVRQFVQVALGGIARKIKGAVVACAHPSRTGQNTGEGSSGSVQWDAAFRSRLYLSMPPANGAEPDPNARVLTRKKANYAPRDEAVDLRWQDGVFVGKQQQAGGIIGSIERRTCERVFLDLVDKTAAENQPVSSNSRAGNYAPKLFSIRPDGKGYTKDDFARAMQRLLARGAVVNVNYGRKGDERTRMALAAQGGQA